MFRAQLLHSAERLHTSPVHVGLGHSQLHTSMLCDCADPQHRPAMSEEAAAAIDADAARDSASQSKAHKPFSDSAHGFPDPDGGANGYVKPQKTVDASQVAEKVGVAVFGPACALVTGCCCLL